jgi:hypothetical protein
MKTFLRNIFIFIIIVAFGLGSQAFAAEVELRDGASNTAADWDQFIEENLPLVTYFNRKIDNNSETIHLLADVKVLHDFSNNEYYLFEYDPFGYLIYSYEFGVILEYSSECVSPYQGREGSLLYFGPKEYYSYENGAFKNTVTRSMLNNDDISEYVMVSRRITEELRLNADNELLDSYSLDISDCTERNSVFNQQLRTTYTYVAYSGFISDLRTAYEIGYYYDGVGNGYCGYIAANMLMFYYDRVVDTDFVDSQYVTWHYSTQLGRNIWCLAGSGLTEHLISLSGTPGGTTAYSIASVIEDYCLDQGVSIYSYTPFVFTKNYIKGRIDDNNPVILFGDLVFPTSGSGFHAVLVYGYTSDDDLICHFGWANYHSVIVNGIWGSVYSLDCI